MGWGTHILEIKTLCPPFSRLSQALKRQSKHQHEDRPRGKVLKTEVAVTRPSVGEREGISVRHPCPSMPGHLLFVISFGVVLLQGWGAVSLVWMLAPGGAKATELTR